MSLGRVLAMGARTPAGLDARQVLLTARAQRWPPRRLDLPPSDGSIEEGPTSHGTVRAAYLSDDLWGSDRLIALAAPALAECVRTCAEVLPGPLPLVLAGPERRADDVLPPARGFLADLAEAAGVKLDLARSEIVMGGHAGFAVALDRALGVSAAVGGPILVGAADTYHSVSGLRALHAELRLHGPFCHDGIIPSEGAAFFVVDARDGVRDRRLATIAAVEWGADETSEDDAEPRIAVAFTEVVRSATSSFLSAKVPWVMVDQNGERHRSKEWSFVAVRLHERFDVDRTRLEAPAGSIGDLGAASGGVFAAMACSAWQLGIGHGPSVLIALAADGPPRGAILLEAPR